jgi:hypothetical protein
MVAADALLGPTSEGKVNKVYNLPGAETGPGGVATWGRATVDRAWMHSVSAEPQRGSPASSSPSSERPD